MQFTLSHIAKITSGSIIQNRVEADEVIKHFITDSRKVRLTSQTIFVALRTNVRDGHDFIQAAYAQSVRCFLISTKTIDISKFPDASFVFVADTLRALQALAKANRSQFDIPVYGITGSNGKTIIKEWLGQLLGHEAHVVKSPKSYNSQIGVALSVAAMNARHEIALFEAGISQPNEMELLADIILPSHGIFTMIGAAHGIHFKNEEEKIKEKLKLFKRSKKLYYCLDHSLIHKEVASFVANENTQLQLCTWGESTRADLQILQRLSTKLETVLRLRFGENDFDFKLPYTDSAYIENAMHCMLVMLDGGYEFSQLTKWFSELSPVKMRLELLKGINDCTIIIDTYSSDLASLRIALDFLTSKNNTNNSALFCQIFCSMAQLKRFILR